MNLGTSSEPSRRTRPRLWRSAGLRLALVYAALFALSALALVIFLWWATAGLLDRQVEAAIRADAQGLSEQWQDGGLPALQATIEDRLAQNVDDDAIYLLANAQFRPIAGNLAHWPARVTEPDQSTSCASSAPASSRWPGCGGSTCRMGTAC